jgi:hypothetical protein
VCLHAQEQDRSGGTPGFTQAYEAERDLLYRASRERNASQRRGRHRGGDRLKTRRENPSAMLQLLAESSSDIGPAR